MTEGPPWLRTRAAQPPGLRGCPLSGRAAMGTAVSARQVLCRVMSPYRFSRRFRASGPCRCRTPGGGARWHRHGQAVRHQLCALVAPAPGAAREGAGRARVCRHRRHAHRHGPADAVLLSFLRQRARPSGLSRQPAASAPARRVRSRRSVGIDQTSVTGHVRNSAGPPGPETSGAVGRMRIAGPASHAATGA
jgi:hypothetical protein